MKEFEVYVKSHCEAPDYEAVFEAHSKVELLNTLLSTTFWDWDREVLSKHIEEVNNDNRRA